MCKECGCGLPGDEGVGINAPHQDEHAHNHTHEHTHADGHTHTHLHVHDDDTARDHEPEHDRDHDHPHDHEHDHASQARRTLEIRQAILAKNERFAERNRSFFRGRGLTALNVLSGPGSGKTTFLLETVRALGDRLKAGIIVGDLATDNDARRLGETGAPVVQITTGTVCHLEAEMVGRALGQLDSKGLDLLIIENVGNLVCPASYDLGEDLRVVLLSVTEGEDKPLKYPPMFQSANVVVISKIDLAKPCGYDRESALANLRRVAAGARIFETSARTGQGMEEWCQFLLEQQRQINKRSLLNV